jgi:phosphopantothenoylcysteine decarboxylase
MTTDLQTCVLRAWNAKTRTCVVCPAMNTQMYLHPITEVQLAQLKAWGYAVIDPIIKTLICGDTGMDCIDWIF